MYSIKRLTELALGEVGYLEKASNASLDSKTANAGSNNYTKYWRDVVPSMQGCYWCACFVSWLFMKAYGQEAAKKLLLHWPYTTSQVCYEKFKAVGRAFSEPKPGDIVVFWNGSRMYHTGIVISVSGGVFTTVEGNTSGGSSIVANGGGVAKKQYSIATAKASGHKFLRPDYGAQVQTKDCSKSVKAWQSYMNKYFKAELKKYRKELLEVDGVFGPKSKAAALCVWKCHVNALYAAGAIPSSTSYGSSCMKVADKCQIRKGSESVFVAIAKGILAGSGVFGSTTINKNFKDKTDKAVRNYQELKGLVVDGIVGPKTWEKMLG